MHLKLIDYFILIVYFAFVVVIGYSLKKKATTAAGFLYSRSLPLWITSLAFISANLGAQEMLGMAASGAKYGIMTVHFYWIGAIPAMVFLGIFMMPFYYGSRARSVPEYLALRFDEKTRGFNAISFACLTVTTAGVSLYGLAILLHALLGWSLSFSIILAAGIVMAYTFLGGLTSAIYNEVLQFFLIIFGMLPLVIVSLAKAGGAAGLVANLPESMTHAWQHMGAPENNPMGVTSSQIILGLGFVLSFGYWCTDFLVVQRAMSAGSLREAQKTPIVAAFPKTFLPFVVILPGLIAAALASSHASGFSLPLKGDGRVDYDMTLPSLLLQFYPSGLLGLGLTALMASFMSGMAGGVTAFNSVWTYDIYQAYIKPQATDQHYLRVARFANVGGILLSIVLAYVAMQYNNIMDLIQLVCGFVNAPLFATFLLGMFWKRTTGHGAFFGLLGGTLAAALFYGVTVAEGKGGGLVSEPLYVFPSGMGQALTLAIFAWTSCFLLTIVISLFTKAKPDSDLRGLVYSLTERPPKEAGSWWSEPKWLGLIICLVTVVLNLIFA
jgi:SSS family solute:Na+ symporter